MWIFTIVAMVYVDRAGRKPLLLFGSLGMTICLVAMGCAIMLGNSSAMLLLLVIAYIACFAFSVGPVTWIVLSEIFPIRRSCQGHCAQHCCSLGEQLRRLPDLSDAGREPYPHCAFWTWLPILPVRRLLRCRDMLWCGAAFPVKQRIGHWKRYPIGGNRRTFKLMDRREFVKTGAVATSGLLLPHRSVARLANTQSIAVRLEAPESDEDAAGIARALQRTAHAEWRIVDCHRIKLRQARWRVTNSYDR